VSFWIIAVVLLALIGNWVVHKFRQFRIRIKQLEIELYFYIEYYGKEREKERAEEAGKKNTTKER